MSDATFSLDPEELEFLGSKGFLVSPDDEKKPKRSERDFEIIGGNQVNSFRIDASRATRPLAGENFRRSSF
jgi:hypothetical protein